MENPELNVFVSFIDAYRLEELNCVLSYNIACYWNSISTINEDPRFAYVHELVHKSPENLFNISMTPAPTVDQALNFLQENHDFYIHVFPIVNILEKDGVKTYQKTNLFGFTINRYINNNLVLMVSHKELDNIDNNLNVSNNYQISTTGYDTFNKAKQIACSYCISLLYYELLAGQKETTHVNTIITE